MIIDLRKVSDKKEFLDKAKSFIVGSCRPPEELTEEKYDKNEVFEKLLFSGLLAGF